MSLPLILGTQHKELVHANAETYNENAILKILKWLSNKTATLHQTLTESLLQGEDCSLLSDAQLLVTLLRALGLRVRLVMVLNPIPFKESKSSNKRKSAESNEQTAVSHEGKESEEQMELTVELDAPSSKETKPSGKRKRKDCHEKSQSKSGKSGNDGKKADDDGTNKTTTGTMGKKPHQSTNEGSSSSCAGRQTQKRTRKRSQATKQQKQDSASTSSPYFKKQTRHRSSTSSRDMEEEDPSNLEQSTSKQSSGSDSEYVPEKVKPKKRNLSTSFEGIGGNNDDDDSEEDDDFQQPKKKRRRSSSKLVGATPAKKLKQAADKKTKAGVQSKPLKSSSKTATLRRKSKSTTFSDSKDSDSNQAMEGESKSQSKPVALHVERKDANLTAASNSDTNQSRGSSLESVEIVKSEETACWAEVYLTVAVHGGTEGRMRGEGEKEEEAKRWRCVHLPSCSVDQPHLCEKHCTIPLHYIIAIENGELNVQLNLYST